MIIVRSYQTHVEDLFDPARLPSVAELRPESCPGCGQLAHLPGKPLGIVGHGTYRRQVLGVQAFLAETIIRVRRYLCRGCQQTISVLPDQLHPHRWYSGGAILEALCLHLIQGLKEREVREHLRIDIDSGSWRSLRRWRSELLSSLWYWLARRLGARGRARTRGEGRRRLRRLFFEASAVSGPEAARLLLHSTVHSQGVAWSLGRAPPESV